MSQETVIDNVTISQLEEAKTLSSGDYLLISEQTEEGKYESKKISYSTLRNQVSTDLNISSLEYRISDIVLSVDPKIVSVQNEGYQIISSFEQDNRGRIQNLSSYQLSDALNFILANVELDNLSATNSPWVQLTDVVKDTNTPTSDEKVVGMSLLSAILSDISSNYILTSNIAQEVGDDPTKVISQKCFYNFLSGLSDQYVLSDDIINTLSDTEIQYDRRKVISQSVFNELKRMILSTLVLKSDIITAFVETPDDPAFYNPDKVASQVLVKSIKDYVDQTFVTKQMFQPFNESISNMIPLSYITNEIGESNEMIMSQKAITELFNNLSSFQDVDYSSGYSESKAVILTPTGIKTRALLETYYICESEIDETKVKADDKRSGDYNDYLVTLFGNSYEVKQYLSTNNSWEKILELSDNESVCQWLNAGRFARNPITNKTFFIGLSTINKIAEVWDASR